MTSNQIEHISEIVTPEEVTALQLEKLADAFESVQESMGLLELSREDRGWSKLTEGAIQEFSREGIRRASEINRVLAIANPLTKRALSLRHAYVWGQGVGTTARGDGTDGTLDVNLVVQKYLDDDQNRASFTGSQAAEVLEKALGTDGNVFLVNFTDPLDGEVQTRTLPFDEIGDIITNPDDRTDPWFYKRTYSRSVLDVATGRTESKPTTVYYPALKFRPQMRPRTIAGDPILWDAPVYHVKVNGLDGWKYGIGDVYASAPWVKAYKEFLEDWAVYMRSLSRITWQIVTEKGSQAQRSRQAVKDMEGGAGQTASMSGAKLEAIPKSGATLDSDSGRPLAAMAAAGFGLPVTMLLSDPGVTGARAVAQTLDLPTRLELQGRQSLWSEARRAILGHVIDSSVIAPNGTLKGTVQRKGDRLIVELAKGTDRTLDIVWPELDETPIDILIQAIVNADSTMKVPPLVTLRLLLRALKLKDVDEILDDVTDQDGNFIDPTATAGKTAMRKFRDGDTGGVIGTDVDDEIRNRQDDPAPRPGQPNAS